MGGWPKELEALEQEIQRLKNKDDDQIQVTEKKDNKIKELSENIADLESRLKVLKEYSDWEMLFTK